MNYEEKYNAAIERAGKELQELKNKDCDDMTRRTAITIIHNLFPELQESEDERIRKVLLNDFKNNCSEYYCEGVNRDMIIAWLEKQGEKKSIFNADDWYVSEVDGKIHNAKFIFIEKQGEKKDFTFKSIPRLLEMVPPTDKAKSYCEKLRDSLQAEGYHTDSKIVGEHLKHMNGEAIAVATSDENVDKPESKFKVGDWFVNNNRKDVFLIKSINTNGYCALEDIKGNIISPCLPPCESDSHIWTIEDAKDGDVLLEEETGEPFIYNGNRATYFSGYFLGSYCGISNGEFNLYGNMHYWGKNSCPATKKQRDLLFQKMEEAGYEWDADKKELKKI